MKLIRFGEAGRERPGLIVEGGRSIDVSGFGADYDEAFFGSGGLERLARWLLMSQDRIGSATVPLTQEFLAHMLGTRRSSVSVAAGVLQKAGLITYTRGSVQIENRSGLMSASCECYESMLRQSASWKLESG